MDDVITVEPTSISANSPEGNTCIYSDGSVRVRYMRDTPEDCAFAARLSVEAFRGKVVHATSERSVPKFIECYEKSMHGQSSQYYERNFIAEYNGEKAGLVTIKFHGDPSERDNGAWNSLGCCDTMGLIGLSITAISGKNIPKGKCYVDHICVDDKFRGKGIGKVLMDACDNEARKSGCKSIYLDVTTTNRAIHLYERQGYVTQESIYGCCWSYWCFIGVKSFYRMEKQL